MKNLLVIIFALLTLESVGQATMSTKSIKYYADCVINEYSPTEEVSYKYDKNLRFVVFNDYLKNGDKYSSDALELLGYTYFKDTDNDSEHNTTVYRNCDTGVVIEVTEWYYVKYSISVEWYAPSVRPGIIFLMSCK